MTFRVMTIADYENEIPTLALCARKKADCGRNSYRTLVFAKNVEGNAFWEHEGFTERTDITYRNKALAEIVRIDT